MNNDVLLHIGMSMTNRALAHLTPILQHEADGSATLVGTGTYIDIEGQLFLLTCDHVTMFGKNMPLLVLPHGQEECTPGPQEVIVKRPEDIALGRIPDPEKSPRHASVGLHHSAFALRHQPVDGEVLYFLGMPGEESKYVVLLKTAFASAEPRLAFEIPRFATDPPFVFRLPHSSEMATSLGNGTERPALNPQGFSGSLVWNTRYVECVRENRPWKPEYAQVTGIVRRWDSGATHLTCCRSEEILSFMNAVASSDPNSIPLEE